MELCTMAELSTMYNYAGGRIAAGRVFDTNDNSSIPMSTIVDLYTVSNTRWMENVFVRAGISMSHVIAVWHRANCFPLVYS